MTASTHTLGSVASGSGYVRGCRCDECKAANTRRVARRQAERRAARVEVGGRPVAVAAKAHGLVGTYVNHGCRCESCTTAMSRRVQVAKRARMEAAR